MYSHDNLTYTTRVVVETYDWDKEPQSVVSYLPMSHVAAIDFDVFCLMQSGGTMYCADKNALKGTLVRPSPSCFQFCNDNTTLTNEKCVCVLSYISEK